MKLNGIDIYQAKIEDETDGVYCISLVDFPAVERNFVAFKENQEKVKFSIENEEKHNITGVVMLADVPIYRRTGDYEYFITYSRPTIEVMANKLLKDGFQNRVDIMHDGELITGISMTELYIKDSTKGINPNFIEDVTEGSLMATFHVESEELWDEIKNGDILNGFSLEGLFTIEKMQNNKINKNSTMNKISKFVKSLMKFGEVNTDKGNLYWDGEGEIEVGVEVYVDGEEETKVIAGDGEYTVEGGDVIVVAEGKVTEIRKPETEEEEVVVSAAKQKFERVKEAFEETYQEKENKIITAIRAKGFDCWLVEASDEYAVVEIWNDATGSYTNYKFPVSWDGEEPVIGDPEEVKSEYVPVKETVEEPVVEVTEQFAEENPDKPEEETEKPVEVVDEPVEEKPEPEERDEKQERIEKLEGDVEALRDEIELLKEELAKLNNQPAATPITEQFEAINKPEIESGNIVAALKATKKKLH